MYNLKVNGRVRNEKWQPKPWETVRSAIGDGYVLAVRERDDRFMYALYLIPYVIVHTLNILSRVIRGRRMKLEIQSIRH